MKYIEVKNLKKLCEDEGETNVKVSLLPWTNNEYILLFDTVGSSYILRVKAKKEPRTFRFIETAVELCRESGFKTMKIVFHSK